jgi:GNAT superfamily N-acetyltransferase
VARSRAFSPYSIDSGKADHCRYGDSVDPTLHLRDLTADQIDDLTAAFLDWPKTRGSFMRWLARVADGSYNLIVARIDGRIVGYTGIHWASDYPPFAAAGIPEINDFNVLPEFRRRGFGSALLDEAESRIALRSEVAGVGVGLYGDYGSAQRLYVKRGYLPDGLGITRDGVPVVAGTSVPIDDDTVLWFTKRLR